MFPDSKEFFLVLRKLWWSCQKNKNRFQIYIIIKKKVVWTSYGKVRAKEKAAGY